MAQTKRKLEGQGASSAPPADEIPELDDRAAKFATLLMQGKTGADAYRESHNVHHWTPNAVWVAACRLRADANVKLWIDQAKRLTLLDTACTLESHLSELERLKNLAAENGNYGAAVQAEKIRGEVAGHKTERVQILPTSPEQTLAEIAAIDPQLAAKLAQQEGVDWQPDGKTSKAVH